MFTRHGHHIQGSILIDCERSVARCGGPGLCHECSTDVLHWQNTHGKEDMADNLKGIPFSSEDEGIDFPAKAKRLVQHQINVVGIGTPRTEKVEPIGLGEIYVVWFGFTLGNWKAILSTSRPDGRIWEVTHNKAKRETYVDTYLKTHNFCVADEVLQAL